MRRDLVNFMSDKNKKDAAGARVVGEKDTTIYNIRKGEKGLYFDLKTTGELEVSFYDLFIPAKFYQTQNINLSKSVVIINKKSLLEYFLLYPAAIISIAYIIKTLVDHWGVIRNILGL